MEPLKSIIRYGLKAGGQKVSFTLGELPSMSVQGKINSFDNFSPVDQKLINGLVEFLFPGEKKKNYLSKPTESVLNISDTFKMKVLGGVSPKPWIYIYFPGNDALADQDLKRISMANSNFTQSVTLEPDLGSLFSTPVSQQSSPGSIRPPVDQNQGMAKQNLAASIPVNQGVNIQVANAVPPIKNGIPSPDMNGSNLLENPPPLKDITVSQNSSMQAISFDFSSPVVSPEVNAQAAGKSSSGSNADGFVPSFSGDLSFDAHAAEGNGLDEGGGSSAEDEHGLPSNPLFSSSSANTVGENPGSPGLDFSVANSTSVSPAIGDIGLNAAENSGESSELGLAFEKSADFDASAMAFEKPSNSLATEIDSEKPSDFSNIGLAFEISKPVQKDGESDYHYDNQPSFSIASDISGGNKSIGIANFSNPIHPSPSPSPVFAAPVPNVAAAEAQFAQNGQMSANLSGNMLAATMNQGYQNSVPYQMTVPSVQYVMAPSAGPSKNDDEDQVIEFGDNEPKAKTKENDDPPINGILIEMIKRRASDLHLTLGQPIMYRVDGDIARVGENPIDASMMQELLEPIIPPRNYKEFAKSNDTDFAYEIKGVGRFRVNMFRDRNGVGSVMRHIPSQIITMEKLNLSPVFKKFCLLSKGLVVVTGPTGSGKSTTLAAMIDYINKTRKTHIITIEDPIEFVHPQQAALINQREIARHTQGFTRALRAALREDPDIVLIGEMRDLETVSIAIETAETGHLVFGTLHTNTAVSTIDRIIDQFPTEQQQQIRMMLAAGLKGVISQTLLKKKGGGRVAAHEILVLNDAVSAMIREGKNHMIGNHMTTQKSDGNLMLNDALISLIESGAVDPLEAFIKCVDKKDFLDKAKRKNININMDLKEAAA